MSSSTGESRLRFLNDRKPSWRRPDDPVVEAVIIPALQVAERFDCMVGYFGGGALRELAPGLASFIVRTDAPVRLLVSPVISVTDQESIREGTRAAQDVLASAIALAFSDEVSLTSALADHTKQCLAYLIATRRLQMKVVMVKDAKFHLKEWIFGAGPDVAVLSGSANFTGQALAKNVEKLNLHRSWRGADNAAACADTLAEFDLYWLNQKPHAVAIDLPLAVQENLVRSYDTNEPPTENDFQRALQLEGRFEADEAPPDTSSTSPAPGFRPPPGVIWEAGLYGHQGKAVFAWEAAGRRGILAMATGAGKTIAALICAWRLYREVQHLLIIVAVPTRPLVSQWAGEAIEFGLHPYAVGNDPSKKRLSETSRRIANLELGVSAVETIIVTNSFLTDPTFKEVVRQYDGPVLLIADEVHNLGTAKYLDDPLSCASYRLGLSATPERQYDDIGTARLVEHFGETVYEFSLRDAIGICLVPYDYHLHVVDLTETEMDSYRLLTDKILKLIQRTSGVPDGNEAELLQTLLNRRRLVLEGASGKITRLAEILEQIGPGNIHNALFYATDKDPHQLNEVNALLQDLGVRYHQITAEETGSASLVKSSIDAFRQGHLQALTAKRVLDEGLNVPEITIAFVLASTTVRRQWVQRRGRVLRMCPPINKLKAVIHDFVVLPPYAEARDEVAKKMIKSELERCDEFTELALNRAAHDGPREVLQDIRINYLI